jgi:hypothetical protein
MGIYTFLTDIFQDFYPCFIVKRTGMNTGMLLPGLKSG